MLPRSIRFGWETEPTGPGAKVVIFSKIDTYDGSVRKPHLPSLEVQNWTKKPRTKWLYIVGNLR